jgi:hypothetical protein
MRDVRSIDASCGFVVTAQGREALEMSQGCDCCDLLVVDGALRCRECGTVYGVVYGHFKGPRRRWRSAEASS